MVVDSIGPDDDHAHAVSIDTTGRIVLAGETRISGGEVDATVTRYLASGTPDPSFGQAGHGIYFPGGFSSATAFSILADGRLLGGVSAPRSSFLVRLLTAVPKAP